MYRETEPLFRQVSQSVAGYAFETRPRRFVAQSAGACAAHQSPGIDPELCGPPVWPSSSLPAPAIGRPFSTENGFGQRAVTEAVFHSLRCSAPGIRTSV